jgi:hypothetical protein
LENQEDGSIVIGDFSMSKENDTPIAFECRRIGVAMMPEASA